MDSLRARLEETRNASEHNVRLTEHAVFGRLLYRNKNQHRHGLYFRRLQHTQRLICQINQHMVWKSLRSALASSTNGTTQASTKKKRKSTQLLLSTVTRDDVNDVIRLFDALTSSVIPGAATAVTTQLVVRHHFLPFAVSILSSLSRIFVIERKLLYDFRAISVDLNVFLSETADGSSLHKDSAIPAEEDIGSEIFVSEEEAKQESSVGITSRSGQVSADQISSKMEPAIRQGNGSMKRTKRSENVITPDEGPSLYSIVSQKSRPLPSVSRTKNTISVALISLPSVTSMPKSGSNSNRKRPNDVNHSSDHLLKRVKAQSVPTELNKTTSTNAEQANMLSEEHEPAPGRIRSPPGYPLLKRGMDDSVSGADDIGSTPQNESGTRFNRPWISTNIAGKTQNSDQLNDTSAVGKLAESLPKEDKGKDSDSEDLDDIFEVLED